jgi:hypothetical protein
MAAQVPYVDPSWAARAELARVAAELADARERAHRSDHNAAAHAERCRVAEAELARLRTAAAVAATAAREERDQETFNARVRAAEAVAAAEARVVRISAEVVAEANRREAAARAAADAARGELAPVPAAAP